MSSQPHPLVAISGTPGLATPWRASWWARRRRNREGSAPSATRSGGFRRVGRRIGLGRALAIALTMAFIAVRIWDPYPVEAIRLRTFDFFQMVSPRKPIPTRPVMIVDIDEASLGAVGQWPWPRTLVAEIVTKLTQAGAVAIAFDIAFPEPDRLSPNLVADSLPNLDERTKSILKAQPSHDDVLASAMGASRVILGQTALSQAGAPVDPAQYPSTGFAFLGPDASRFIPSFPGLLRNVPALEQAAAGRGLFTILPEQDGIVRRVPLFLYAGGSPAPTLSVEILRVLTGAGAVLVRTDAAGVRGIALPQIEIPTDPYGQIWVHFAPHDPSRYISAKDVLTGAASPALLANKIVLVGTSALGLLDNKTTPIDRSMPGVEVHLQVLESALTRSTLVVPNYAIAIELLVAVAVCLAIVLFAPILGSLNLLAFGAAVAAFLV
ncbi:MAG: CHASE2 domain-containing protein, partial [Methylobacteriaceae bacterium]|nr:CHASE2 domain-containing protein [Methylobacteriaceae bacterium]